MRGWLASAALLALACGEEAAVGELAADSGFVEVGVGGRGEVSLEAVDPPLPLTRGELRLSVEGTRVSLHANEAPRSEVLQALAAKTGAELDVGSSGIEDRRITARIDDAPLFDVLSLVLRGVDYELVIPFDPVSHLHRVGVLRVASRPGDSGGATATALTEALYDMLDSEDPQVVLAVLDALGRAGDEDAVAEIEPLLDDDDERIRGAAERSIESITSLDAEPADEPDLEPARDADR